MIETSRCGGCPKDVVLKAGWMSGMSLEKTVETGDLMPWNAEAAETGDVLYWNVEEPASSPSPTLMTSGLSSPESGSIISRISRTG